MEKKDYENKSKKVNEEAKTFYETAPKNNGVLDMVIAFDTTGSMAAYIDAVRKEVADLVPSLFKNNEDLRLGIVAFGDYCDMETPKIFGNAFQFLQPTNNENEIIKFIKETKDTSGGDGDEFYELVLKKIIEETPWREDSTRVILLIADAEPHPIGYCFENIVENNQIDWRKEAQKAVGKGIKIDTVSITDSPWYQELSYMTNGVHAPFQSGYKTGRLIEAATLARGSIRARESWDMNSEICADPEMSKVYALYRNERNTWKK